MNSYYQSRRVYHDNEKEKDDQSVVLVFIILVALCLGIYIAVSRFHIRPQQIVEGCLYLICGLAAAIVDADVSWSETVSIAGRRSPAVAGAGHNTQVLWGFYLGANAAYQFSERWSAILGVQFQDVGTYSHSFGGRQVDADLGHSVFVTAGVGWNF